MSILRSLQTGASGLRAHAEAISATGDNIANVNTIAFKRSRANFQDVLGRSIAGSANIPMAGAGARLAHIETMWAQGALLTSDVPTDLAISGNGLFVVNGTVGGTTGNFYTRAGQFHVDNTGRLVNPDGLRLQGYSVNDDGSMGSTIGDLVVAGETIPAQATTEVAIAAQLDANAAVPAAWDPADPAGTSNFSTNVTVYDSLGNSHDITVYMRKTATAGEWEWHAMIDGGELTGGTPGVPTEGATGTITFDTTGALVSETPGASSWDFLNATAGQTIAFDFGTSLADDPTGTGLDGSTSFAADSTTTGLTQNGYTAGTVSGLGISADGTITGVFSNGQRRTLGQLTIADFGSEDGLARGGQGLWVETLESGEALLGTAEAGGRGSIVSGALEQSNTDIGLEFVNLIAYQRGFSANSRIISTADDMYLELVNLKR